MERPDLNTKNRIIVTAVHYGHPEAPKWMRSKGAPWDKEP
jgi:hypothetical protein